MKQIQFGIGSILVSVKVFPIFGSFFCRKRNRNRLLKNSPANNASLDFLGVISVEYTVNLTWDPEAAVWFATSTDIIGLALESGSADALIERVRFAVPELLDLNHQVPAVALHFQFERYERISA